MLLFSEKRKKEMTDFKRALELIKNAKKVAILTGAGISAESGVPTFRGRGGLWQKHRADELATPEAFRKDPVLVWKFYDYRRQLISKVKPNKAHKILAEWENSFENTEIVTQNIDGLHQKAGSRKMIELHGNLWEAICLKENKVFEFKENPIKTFPPKCPDCGGLIRPNVVWFGESLSQEILERAFDLFESADVAIVIGTSSIVYPAAYLPQITKKQGGHIIEVNIEETALTPFTDLFFKGKASDVLSQVNSYLF